MTKLGASVFSKVLVQTAPVSGSYFLIDDPPKKLSFR